MLASASGKAMNITTIVVVALTVILLVYLVIALLYPERF